MLQRQIDSFLYLCKFESKVCFIYQLFRFHSPWGRHPSWLRGCSLCEALFFGCTLYTIFMPSIARRLFTASLTLASVLVNFHFKMLCSCYQIIFCLFFHKSLMWWKALSLINTFSNELIKFAREPRFPAIDLGHNEIHKFDDGYCFFPFSCFPSSWQTWKRIGLIIQVLFHQQDTYLIFQCNLIMIHRHFVDN